MSHCPARARTHRESRALLSACSAAVLRYLANSPGHSAGWLAHLRPPRALWIAVPTSPERASLQRELQARPAGALHWLAEVPEYQVQSAVERSHLALPLPASAAARKSLLARTMVRGRLAALPGHPHPTSSVPIQARWMEELHRSPSQRERFAQADLAALVDRCHGLPSAGPAAGRERNAALSRLLTGWDPPRLEQSLQVAQPVSCRCSGFHSGLHPAPASRLPPPAWRSDRHSSRTHPASTRPAPRHLCRSHRPEQPAPSPRQGRQPAVLHPSPPHLQPARAQSRAPGLAERLQPARTGPRQADLERSDSA
jgi:hypothetical protein